MSNFTEVILACENATGAGSKKEIQAHLAKADSVAQRLIKEALDPYRIFGVKKYDMPQHASKCMEEQHDYNALFLVLDQLASRELTGDAARAAVTHIIGTFNHYAQPIIARIFDKDLKGGFSADTVNKVFPNLVPSFEVMLADKCDEFEDFEKYITFPCQADFKYDGERTIAIVKKDSVTYFSRSGKEATHVNGLFDEELQRIRGAYGEDFVLDGERCSDLGFTDTVNAKKAGNDEAKANLRFRAFFLMPLRHWLVQKTNITMRDTRSILTEMLKINRCEKIILSEGREVMNYQDMADFCNEAIDKPENKARKIEGLILKEWNAVYEWDRKITWCKVKRFFDVDCLVVGTYKGKPKSRLADLMGGIEVVGFTESGERVEARCGSGFSDEHRAMTDWIGKTVVIKYQDVTRSKSKEVSSLRFPTFVRERDDKVVVID